MQSFSDVRFSALLTIKFGFLKILWRSYGILHTVTFVRKLFSLLGAFDKLRKETISYVMSVCSYFRLLAWDN